MGFWFVPIVNIALAACFVVRPIAREQGRWEGRGKADEGSAAVPPNLRLLLPPPWGWRGGPAPFISRGGLGAGPPRLV